MKYKNSITSIIPILISVSCLYVFYIKVDDFNAFFSELRSANYLYILTKKGLTEKTKLTLLFMERKMREYDELNKEINKGKNK